MKNNQKYLCVLGLYCISVSHAFGITLEHTSEGLGIESVLGGVGQARLGSPGALNSNPALLAWLPEKKQFSSTNQIRFIKLPQENGDNITISPDIIPRLASTSRGNGNSGYAYGVILNKQKVLFNRVDSIEETEGESENQEIYLNYGIGKNFFKNHALGLNLFFGRYNDKAVFSILNKKSPTKSSFVSRSENVFWSQGLSLGFASEIESWSFGVSSKFTTAKFGATSSDRSSGIIEYQTTILNQTKHQVDKISVIPSYAAGVRKKNLNIEYSLDVIYAQSYFDHDTEEYNPSHISGALGVEGNLNQEYRWYSGLAYSPGQSKDDQSSGTLSFGFSEQGDHSLNYAGISWARAIEKADSEVITMNFGTQFDY